MSEKAGYFVWFVVWAREMSQGVNGERLDGEHGSIVRAPLVIMCKWLAVIMHNAV
jgi:hypothetical protein